MGISNSIYLLIRYFLIDSTQRVRVGPHLSLASLRAVSPSLLPTHMWLHLHSPQQQHHKVYWWHHPGGAHHRWRRVCIRGWSGTADSVLYKKEKKKLILNPTKMKEIVLNLRTTDIQPLQVKGDFVERVSNFWFRGVPDREHQHESHH